MLLNTTMVYAQTYSLRQCFCKYPLAAQYDEVLGAFCSKYSYLRDCQ